MIKDYKFAEAIARKEKLKEGCKKSTKKTEKKVDKKPKAMKEEALNEATYAVSTVEDAGEAISDILSMLYSKRNRRIVNDLLAKAIARSITAVYPEDAELNKKLIMKNLYNLKLA